MNTSDDVTLVLKAACEGDRDAEERLWNLVYDELRHMAHRQLAREYNRRHLSTTALVHEAYLRLFNDAPVAWESRAHFFGIASRVMRRVIVDTARRYQAQKRGGGRQELAFDESHFVPEDRMQEVIEVDEALEKLTEVHARWGRVVECKYFAGLKEDEIADILDVSVRTVERDWSKARTWLYHYLHTPVTAR